MSALLIFLQEETARNLNGAPGEALVESTIINMVHVAQISHRDNGGNRHWHRGRDFRF